MIARHLAITGRVQGVFFRDWAVKTAREIGITGWVRNRRDGSVEAVAIGRGEAVARFIEACRKGPPDSRVGGVKVGEAEIEPLRDFERRPTA